MLVRLIYISKVSTEAKVDTPQIEQILKSAQRNNKRDGITGYLCFSDGYFLQVLEGEGTAVSATFLRIAQDPRHTELVLLVYTPVMERLLGEWAMGYLSDRTIIRRFCLKHSPSDCFDPLICPDNAMQIVLALAKNRVK